MSLQLYDLAGAEPERRFSPYCWRTKLAPRTQGPRSRNNPLALHRQGHDRLLGAGTGTGPCRWRSGCIEFMGRSRPTWRRPMTDRPSLFGGPAAKALARFVNSWADNVVAPGIARLVLMDIHAHLHEKDRAYFRETRARTGSERSSRRCLPIATRALWPFVKVSSQCASCSVLNPSSVAIHRTMPITSSSAVSNGRVASANSICSQRTTPSLRGALDCLGRSMVWLGTR